MRARPEWARSCDDCRKYLHDENGHKQRNKLTLALIERPAFSKPECSRCPKVPADAPRKHWDYAADLTPMLAQIWNYYRQCKATGGHFPDDPLVKMCATMIMDAEELAAEHKQGMADQRQEFLLRIAMQGGRHGGNR